MSLPLTATGTERADRYSWQTACVYQIYPASFKDSNGDGFGDLPGIISKIDHLESLGVNAVWLSPCYESPNVDGGYDISNYRKIDPRFGTVADIELLIRSLDEVNIWLILDLVVNHASDQHEWFRESRSSKTNAKCNWYIWRKGKSITIGDECVRTPPNNWKSQFQGSAWEYDAHTDEYYLHLFAAQQPDLN
nr:hypothetical protein B0A51_11047 [Rachicladosporium sp. CCFEE 5018]OQO27789.1 hypothetical protein B0A51_05847 [Rachicladosporium sp. CCFEE 5018]